MNAHNPETEVIQPIKFRPFYDESLTKKKEDI